MPAPEPSALPPETVLRLTGITKRFGALVANDGIHLDLARGEVLALLGENGAGKSTLVSILFGHYVADAGSIEVHGRPLPPGEPKAALAAGIGMVHQHFTLAHNLSVLDNVMLGTEPLTRWRSRRAQARAKLLEEAARFGLAVDPEARVGSLSVGERQRVEILKCLVRGARILILDEPTAVLTPQESASLFATLTQMVAQGLSIVFISHKLDEVLRVSHRIAVLRAGKLIAVLPAAGADKPLLAEAMVGRSVAPAVRTRTHEPGEVVAALRGATVPGPVRPLLDGVDLTVRRGEVVAIAGVSGNGQAVLAEVMFGQRALQAGQWLLHGRPLPPRPRAVAQAGQWLLHGRPLPPRPRAVAQAGVARVPEDRHGDGAVGDLSLVDNAVLERHAEPGFARWGLRRAGAALGFAQRLVAAFDVRGGGLSQPVRRLSGGNLQKLLLGRVLLDATPPLIVVHQPTWGLDVGAVADIHQRLLDAAAAGSAVIVISEDLDEVFAIADRIAVMHQGRLGPARPTREWTLASIGLAMAGAGETHAAA